MKKQSNSFKKQNRPKQALKDDFSVLKCTVRTSLWGFIVLSEEPRHWLELGRDALHLCGFSLTAQPQLNPLTPRN